MVRFRKNDGSEYPDWKEQLLSNLVAHYGGTALESFVSKDGKCKFISIGNYSPDGKYIDNGQRINPIGKAAEKRLNKNDLVMVLNDKTSAGTIIGSTILIDSDNYIYNQRSERMVCNENVFPMFMWYYINSPIIKNKILKMKQGATQIYVNFISVYNMKTKIPCLEEQQKIADFLSKVDKKIANQESIVSNYEEMKKGLMQKIFSQEVRFKVDDGNEYPEWEEKKLLNIGSIITGTTPSTKNEEYYSDKYLWVTPADIEDKEISNTQKKLSENGLKKGRIIPANSVLVTCIASIGKNTILRELGSCNQQINAITPNKEYNVDFVYYLVCFNENMLHANAGHGGMEILNKDQFSKLSMHFPCLEEQQKIADCLSAMDRKIEAEKKILEDWKELKKALLQQMFV